MAGKKSAKPERASRRFRKSQPIKKVRKQRRANSAPKPKAKSKAGPTSKRGAVERGEPFDIRDVHITIPQSWISEIKSIVGSRIFGTAITLIALVIVGIAGARLLTKRISQISPPMTAPIEGVAEDALSYTNIEEKNS
jgi:hypothetical protein